VAAPVLKRGLPTEAEAAGDQRPVDHDLMSDQCWLFKDQTKPNTNVDTHDRLFQYRIVRKTW
jgi:hypothetical protein